jgi:hypothetical protein
VGTRHQAVCHTSVVPRILPRSHLSGPNVLRAQDRQHAGAGDALNIGGTGRRQAEDRQHHDLEVGPGVDSQQRPYEGAQPAKGQGEQHVFGDVDPDHPSPEVRRHQRTGTAAKHGINH